MGSEFTIEDIRKELADIDEGLKTAPPEKRGAFMASRRTWENRLKEALPGQPEPSKPTVPTVAGPEFTEANIRKELEEIEVRLKDKKLTRQKKQGLEKSRQTWLNRLAELGVDVTGLVLSKGEASSVETPAGLPAE